MSTNTEASFEVGDKVLFADADWTELAWYKVRAISEKISVGRFDDFLDHNPPVEVDKTRNSSLFQNPFSMKVSDSNPRLYRAAWVLRDLASSNLRNGGQKVEELIRAIKLDSRVTSISDDLVENILRACVALGVLVAKKGPGRNSQVRNLDLSAEGMETEKRRAFAGSFAGELVAQSERIRNLVEHASTVGTYRENILQSLLRKNVPERYHVATGFVFGCKRQLDIVIYDRLEYAPLFREGDLVVVQPEAVRAVIEVKTTLTKVDLEKSLQLLDQVSLHDDCTPPFFKGIFAFGSDLRPDALNAVIANYFQYDYGSEEHIDFEKLNLIAQPFKHMTSTCVLEHYYGEIAYLQKEDANDRFVPALLYAGSATDLTPQAAHFVQKLLAHLKTPALKNSATNYVLRLLGADSAVSLAAYLASDSWGTYFAIDEGMPGASEAEVESMELQISSVNAWLAGNKWQSPGD